jgi:acetyltransferase-like isoleucine patch superfamily enzyme
MNFRKLAARFLVPGFVITLYYLVKYRAKVSPSAEVELTSNLRFGRDCTIGSFTKIKTDSGKLQFGDRCGVAPGCFISAGQAGIYIGDNFICGPNVSIMGSNYRYLEKGTHLNDAPSESKGVTIGNNVWIGAGSVILDGTVIGDNTIVVANSMLNRRYKPEVILQGSPASVILKR